MVIVAVSGLSGAYEVARDPDVFEYGPHVFVIEAWESCRKIKQKKCAERVRLERTVDGEVNIYNVGGYVPVGKKASLLGSAERVGKGRKDGVQEGSDYSVVCVYYRDGSEVGWSVCWTQVLAYA